MTKKISFLTLALMIVLISAGCSKNITNIKNQRKTASYLGGDHKGNYIWGGAMNLAWNELNDNVLHEKLRLNTSDQTAIDMVDKLNNPPITSNDLDEESYYIKSGYGQQTVDQINKESKEKFPTKSFGNIELQLGPRDIISYAYFLKEVKYKEPFSKTDVVFSSQRVKGFSAKNEQQKNNIKILKYDNDDKFIISILLKDGSDQMYLAKGYDMSNPQDVIKEINNSNSRADLSDDDNFSAPILHLSYNREYKELIKKFLANDGFKDYFIGAMYENIKFDMDEEGARVENEAVIGLGLWGNYEKPQVRNFILDKPYWVIMSRKNSSNPYFILGVNNSNLMEVVN